MYVLQFRFHDYDKWQTMCTRYPTINAAEETIKENPFKSCYRVAEEYTVIRYRAAKKRSDLT